RAEVERCWEPRAAKARLGVFAQDVVMSADEEAEVVVEAARLRMVGRVTTLMPLSHQPRDIAGRAKPISDRLLVEWQAQRVFVTHVRIELMAEAGLIAAGEQAGAGRAAVRTRDVPAVGE